MNTFEKYETKIRDYIENNILKEYSEIVSYSVHILPEVLEKNVEYIFKINLELSEEQQLKLWSNIDYDLFYFYDKQEFEFDFITMIKF